MKTRPDDLVTSNTAAVYNPKIEKSEIVGGLTKREHFAALIMSGAIGHTDMERIAKRSVEGADELIKALNQGQEDEIRS